MLRIGDAAVDFSLPGVDGKTYTLKDFRKKLLAVVFSCNHCPYVHAWEDRILQIARDYADQVDFVLINANDPEKYPEDSFDRMKERARDKGYPFPYLFDASQEVPRAYGATRTPEVFLFDENRRLRYHGAVDDSTDPETVRHHYLRDAIEALLAGNTPPVEETPPVGCTIKWR